MLNASFTVTKMHYLSSYRFVYPPHARYRPQRYKNQPKRIEDYEPGCSSLAEKQAKTVKRLNAVC
jgi:hypothetical protein